MRAAESFRSLAFIRASRFLFFYKLLCSFASRTSLFFDLASSLLPTATLLPMPHDHDILDRKVGRNAQLFARSIARLDTPRDRFPYLRILVSLIEKAHPEWDHSQKKRRQVTRLVDQMSEGALCDKEVTAVVEVRDDEQRA
jgi:hypothetical protein